MECWNCSLGDLRDLFDIPKKSCRIAGDDGVSRNIFRYDAPGAYQGVFANGDVRQDGATRTDRSPLLHQGPLDFPVRLGLQTAFGRSRSRVGIVDEGDAVADEYVVFNGYALTNEGMARNLAVLSDARIFLDLDKCAYLGFVADFAAIEVDELGKLHISPQLDAGGDA